MGARDRWLAELKRAIPEISPHDALALQARGGALIDVREADEIAQGSPPGALRLGRGFLELRIGLAVPQTARPLIVFCASGIRSLFAAETLARLGYTQVHSMSGGFSRWKAEGLPVEVPFTLDHAARERYSRHLLMPEVDRRRPQAARGAPRGPCRRRRSRNLSRHRGTQAAGASGGHRACNSR